MTPLANPTTASETAYNAAHAKTRNVIERCFGVMKSRFRCLDRSGGTLLYSAEKTCKIVVAVAVLHNMCISRRLATAVDADVLRRHNDIQPAPLDQRHAAAAPPRSAVELRRSIVQQF